MTTVAYLGAAESKAITLHSVRQLVPDMYGINLSRCARWMHRHDLIKMLPRSLKFVFQLPLLVLFARELM